MNEAGVKPELECFDTGHTHGIWPLLDMGVLKPPLQFSFIVNVLGGIPPTSSRFSSRRRSCPPARSGRSSASATGTGACWRAALVLGGNIRAGLEDHLYLPNGEMAKSNGELVEVAARMVRDVGRKPATRRAKRARS